MKNRGWLIALFLLALLALSACTSAEAANSVVTENGGITVHGEGEVYATPDQASLSLGVETTAQDVKTAQTNNNSKMNAVITAVKDLGIAESDIQTTSYDIYPQYNYSEKNGQQLTGYQVSNSIQVKVKDLDFLPQVIDTAVAKGANLSYGISFQTSRYEELYQQALANALQKADSKAQAIAKSANISTLQMKNIVEDGSGSATPVYLEKSMNAATDTATTIAEGTLQIIAGVSVYYQY